MLHDQCQGRFPWDGLLALPWDGLLGLRDGLLGVGRLIRAPGRLLGLLEYWESWSKKSTAFHEQVDQGTPLMG